MQGGRYPNSGTHQGEDASNRVQPRPLDHQPRNLLVLLLPLDYFLLADVGRTFLALGSLGRFVAGLDIPLRAGLEPPVCGHHDAKSIGNDDERHGRGGEVQPGGKLVRAAALRVREVGKGEGGAGHDGGEDAFAQLKGVQPLVGDVGDGSLFRLFGWGRGEEQRGDHEEGDGEDAACFSGSVGWGQVRVLGLTRGKGGGEDGSGLGEFEAESVRHGGRVLRHAPRF